MSRWAGVTPIEPARVNLGPTVANLQYTTTMEMLPDGRDLPPPNEQRVLTNVYCPVACLSNQGVAPVATTAQLTLMLTRHGTSEFASSLVLPLSPETGTDNVFGNGVIIADLTNPIIIRSGETPLKLDLWVTVGITAVATLVYVGHQLLDPANNVDQLTPGRVAYQAYSQDEARALL